MDDLISRQAAIDALDKRFDSIPMNQTTEILLLRKDLRELPSTQPETAERTTEMAQNVSDGDLISRKAAMNRIDEALARVFKEPCGELILRKVPSAQPQRKTGKWIERNPQNSPDCRLIECSECGNAYIVGYDIDYDDWIDGRNFCMKCGADLRGGGNGKST